MSANIFDIAHSTVEGVPIKDVMIDAIIGSELREYLADNVWEFDRRAVLVLLDIQTLFAIYGRQKRL